MAQSYYKIVGTQNPTVDWRTQATLEEDENGNIVREITTTEGAQLTGEEKERLEASGLVLEKISAEEAKAGAEAPVAGNDVAAESPILTNQPGAGDGTTTGKTK